MKRAFAIFLLLMSLTTWAIGQTADGKSKSARSVKDEQAIRKVLADFVAAWNKHDAKAFSMVFAANADFTNVRGMNAHGRTEVEKFHAPRFATTLKNSHQKMMEIKIRFIRPDVAAVDAWWEMTGAKTPEGQDTPLRKGLLNLVMTKEGLQWFITIMHNMNLPESP